VRAASTFRQFDDLFTAPVHGFDSAEDYWAKSSSKRQLRNIRVPTLLLNARNDPFIPAHSLPQAADVSASVTLEQPRHGGHAGFASGRFPGHVDWLPARLLHYFAANTSGTSLPRTG